MIRAQIAFMVTNKVKFVRFQAGESLRHLIDLQNTQ